MRVLKHTTYIFCFLYFVFFYNASLLLANNSCFVPQRKCSQSFQGTTLAVFTHKIDTHARRPYLPEMDQVLTVVQSSVILSSCFSHSAVVSLFTVWNEAGVACALFRALFASRLFGQDKCLDKTASWFQMEHSDQ